MGSLPFQVYSWSIDSTKWNRFIPSPSSGLSTFLTEQKKHQTKTTHLNFLIQKKINCTHPIPSPHPPAACSVEDSIHHPKLRSYIEWPDRKTRKKKKQIELFNRQLDASVDSSKFGQFVCRKKSPRKVRPEGFRVLGPVVLMCWFFFFGVCWFGLVGWLGVFVTYKLPMFFL